ncbi:VWA domain-containing protein [Rhizobium sp. MC63]|uniref:VWA domain-containing protein n=1 Tax=Rhizobium mulingense TaxID=3031128 RepID=A0ACC6N661_9HYPH|nr:MULTISPECIES: vWA domain-containing protein [unclassified Rhizobium]MDF0700420.1 VWA domain-containing protein [Rhizobium sp. MC63]MEA3521061.1 vWA domain-containing protein [Rhizobium sp. MJ31]
MSDTEQPDQQTPPTPGSPAPAATPTSTGPISSTPDEPTLEASVDGAPSLSADSQTLQERPKTKGVADIVFLVDVTGSMAPCIDALRRNIEAFIDSLSHGDPNNAAPVKDWRGKVVGYRDIEAAEAEGLPWIVDNDFVRDASALKAQLGTLQANGGGDEPESLLDALYKVASMEAVPRGSQMEDPAKWRYRSDAARVVIVFTDASFKETMSIAEAKGGSLQDVANLIMANRIILSLFAPNFEGYDRLSQIDKSEWEVVEYEGLNPQEALQKFTSDPVNFRNTLKQLAASVSRSAATVAL